LDIKKLSGVAVWGAFVGAILATLGFHFLNHLPLIYAWVASFYTGAPVGAIVFVAVAYALNNRG